MPIIITPAYVLSTTPDENNPHIGYQTWLRDLQDSNVIVSSQADSAPKDAILRPDTHEYWQPSVMPASIVVDLGQPRPVDYVGLAGHTIGSAGGSVKIEHSADGISWTEFGSELAPSTNAPIMFLDASVSRRFWGITFTNSGEAPRLAVVYIGQALVIQRSIYGGHSPANLSRETILNQNMSDGGQFLGQYVRRRGITGNVRLRHLTAGWYRDNFDPFVRAARQYPFFLAWRPVTFPLEVAYGWTDSNIKPSNMGKKDFMEVGFDFKGVGYVD